MNSKERFLTALNHQTPDRVPLDLGGWVTTISEIAYNKLLKKLGIQREREVFDWLRQTVDPEEDVLKRLCVDTRYVHLGRPKSWSFAPTPTEKGLYVTDEWGCGFLKTPTTLYYNLIYSPLANDGIGDIESYAWPDPRDPGYLDGVVQRARSLSEDNEYGVIGDFAWETWYERAWKLRGMEQFYMDMALNRDFVHALLDKTLGLHLEFLDHVLSACGDYLDVVIQGGDLAGQKTTLMSPADYKEFIKPRQAKAIEFIQKKTKAKIFYHCCGAVASLIPDFIDLGIDILNPVQVRAHGMDAKTLKDKFGDKIAFWGGVDSQQVLPNGTAEDVEAEVRDLIRGMGHGGGLVVCAVHNIQADVPPENVLALYDSVSKWGCYPPKKEL
jgi:uroporphyrinogen decarboxylase